jgi:hypothetical protein
MQKAGKLRVEMASCAPEYECGSVYQGMLMAGARGVMSARVMSVVLQKRLPVNFRYAPSATQIARHLYVSRRSRNSRRPLSRRCQEPSSARHLTQGARASEEKIRRIVPDWDQPRGVESHVGPCHDAICLRPVGLIKHDRACSPTRPPRRPSPRERPA